MEDYEQQLHSLSSSERHLPSAVITTEELCRFDFVDDLKKLEESLNFLKLKLPFELRGFPVFCGYAEYWFNIDIKFGKYQLQYWERGSPNIIATCTSIFDLFYEVLKVCRPSYTEHAAKIAENLDSIKDQRLLLWLSESSNIMLFYEVNREYGQMAAFESVKWMSEEVVRMGLCKATSDPDYFKKHILKGITLSGINKDDANKIYQLIKTP